MMFAEYKAEFVRRKGYYGVPKNIAEDYIDRLLSHIKFVIKAAEALGVPSPQTNSHDNSKWTEDEFPGYAMHFCGGGSPDEFSKAWLHHIHHNPHHWQYWIFPDGYSVPNSKVENGIVEMKPCYALEMVADWIGASEAYTGGDDMSEWLYANIPKIKVHSKTKLQLNLILSELGYKIGFE